MHGKSLPVGILRAEKKLVSCYFPCSVCRTNYANCISNAFFIGLMESMRQADLKNWSLDQVQFADLCSSLNQFFTQTGLIHSQSNVQQNVCHSAMHPTKPSQHIGTGNLYIDSRQNLPPSVMPPPGYPHIPQALSTPGTTIAGHHGAMNQQHMMPSQAFQMRRSLPPDDIQDDFDWDSIV